MKKFLKVKFITLIAITILIFNNSIAQTQRSATNIEANKSLKIKSSTHSRTIKKLYLKVFFQGYYNYNTHIMNKTYDINSITGQLFPKFPGAIVDTFSVSLFYLDTINTGGTISYNYGVIDQFDNVTFDVNGICSPIILNANDTAKYFIIINHRNSIETWSAAKVNFLPDSIYYDFSNSVTRAYGNNLIQLASNIAAIFSGDVGNLYNPTSDGIINIFDLSAIYDAMYDPTGVYSNGYVCQDLNGDGSVDIYDLNIIINNMGVQSVGP